MSGGGFIHLLNDEGEPPLAWIPYSTREGFVPNEPIPVVSVKAIDGEKYSFLPNAKDPWYEPRTYFLDRLHLIPHNDTRYGPHHILVTNRIMETTAADGRSISTLLALSPIRHSQWLNSHFPPSPS